MYDKLSRKLHTFDFIVKFTNFFSKKIKNYYKLNF